MFFVIQHFFDPFFYIDPAERQGIDRQPAFCGAQIEHSLRIAALFFKFERLYHFFIAGELYIAAKEHMGYQAERIEPMYGTNDI